MVAVNRAGKHAVAAINKAEKHAVAAIKKENNYADVAARKKAVKAQGNSVKRGPQKYQHAQSMFHGPNEVK